MCGAIFKNPDKPSRCDVFGPPTATTPTNISCSPVLITIGDPVSPNPGRAKLCLGLKAHANN